MKTKNLLLGPVFLNKSFFSKTYDLEFTTYGEPMFRMSAATRIQISIQCIYVYHGTTVEYICAP